MAGETVTRAHLGEVVYQEVGLSRNESADLLETVLSLMTGSLVKGETVKISSFGSFSVRQKGQRIGRNPKTGESVVLDSKAVPHFKPGKELREAVNTAFLESRKA